ncbi:hypothetical protein OOK13_07195 [Streptomyces sp. NBC_00378]|uniref:hypothetical protein n=1 Tax=unclassified Streptomyces TaxID=2593676 RepID=UPI00224FD08C|nr:MULTISPECIES: hypothetical protein [unclassified Streptomyces]MCX5108313.1 hypothetical protein [Streptomyces sp. NBC_00378]
MEEQRKALAEPCAKEGWAAWHEAAATFQAAVTEHAEAAGVPRVELETAVKKAALHPDPKDDS